MEVMDYDVVLHDTIGGFSVKLEDLLHRKRVSLREYTYIYISFNFVVLPVCI